MSDCATNGHQWTPYTKRRLNYCLRCEMSWSEWHAQEIESALERLVEAAKSPHDQSYWARLVDATKAAEKLLEEQ